MRKMIILAMAAILVVAVSGMVFGASDTGKVNVNIAVGSFVKLDPPADLSLTIDGEYDDNGVETAGTTGNFSIKTNTSVAITISSTGYTQATSLNEYITYNISAGDSNVSYDPANPNNSTLSSVESGDATFTVSFREREFIDAGNWANIEADTTVTDEVTFTVASNV